jgi:hypothetical protein
VLTINSVVLNTPAWSVGGDETGEGSLLQLWGLMAERRGEDREIPGAAGVIAYPRIVTVTPYVLRAIIIGDVNSSGVANADDRVGLQSNLATWKTLIDTSSSGDGTVTASLTRFTGSPLTAPVHVLGLDPLEISYSPDGKSGSWFVGELRLSIPSGRLS